MKNRREVCNAKDAGFIQFDNLPGLIKTGCMATPTFKNRYCTEHVNQACTLQNMEIIDEELDEPVGPTIRSLSKQKSVGDPVAETILAKKVTRKQVYYQVIINALTLLCTYICNAYKLHCNVSISNVFLLIICIDRFECTITVTNAKYIFQFVFMVLNTYELSNK